MMTLIWPYIQYWRVDINSMIDYSEYPLLRPLILYYWWPELKYYYYDTIIIVLLSDIPWPFIDDCSSIHIIRHSVEIVLSIQWLIPFNDVWYDGEYSIVVYSVLWFDSVFLFHLFYWLLLILDHSDLMTDGIIRYWWYIIQYQYYIDDIIWHYCCVFVDDE